MMACYKKKLMNSISRYIGITAALFINTKFTEYAKIPIFLSFTYDAQYFIYV